MDRSLAQLLTQIDIAAGLCVASTVATMISAPVLITDGFWCLVPALAAVVALVTYQGAKVAAIHHGVLLATAFDLYRFDLIAGLHYKLPGSPEEERKFNERLSKFLVERETADSMLPNDHYEHPTLQPHP
jgi:hypothetical protein